VYAPRQKARFRLKLLLASIDAHGLVLDDVQCDEVEVIGEYRSGGNEKTHGAESEDEALVCEGEGGAQEACESHQDDEDEPGPVSSTFGEMSRTPRKLANCRFRLECPRPALSPAS